MMRPEPPLRILNAEPERYSPAARAILASFAQVDAEALSLPALRRRIADYDVLIVRLGIRVDEALLSRATRLRAVVSATTCPDHIDLDAAGRRRIEVLSLRDERAFLDSVTATAELAWALLLAGVRRLPSAAASVRAGAWDRNRFVGIELQGRTLGIIGYGRLGTMVARFAKAFRMRVCAHDPAVRTAEEGVTLLPLDRLLRVSDVVSLHVPLSAETKGLLGRPQLALMKPGAWLINTSRGEVLDEAALLAALTSGRLGGAGLDVLAGETGASRRWLRSHPLLRYARQQHNLLVTPHLGGATQESMERTEVFMAQRLQTAASRWRKRGAH